MADVGNETLQLMKLIQSNQEMLVTLHKEYDSQATAHAKLFMIVMGFGIFLMQVGFALVEAGSVRSKNTRNIMLKNVLDACFAAMGFWAIGYALAFGEGNAMFGWRQEDGVPALFNSENEVLFFFQYTFCATATTIAGGAVAERTQFSAYALYSIVISTIIYPVVVHLAWSRSGLLSPWRGANILGTNGFMDNAGSGVVHITGGVTALISCWIVGPRVGRFNLEGLVVPFRSHSLVFTAGGTLFLWLGFFSFNGGSVMFQPAVGLHHWYVTIGHVCMNTCLSAAGAGVATYLLVQTSDISTPFDLLNSLITGAVASCAPASLILPWAAAFVGFCSGAMYLLFARLLMWMRIDDVVNASAVHIAGGMAGIVGVGLFATREGITNTYGIKEPLAIGLCYSGSGRLLLVQILGALFIAAWVGITTFTLFYALHRAGNLRVSRYDEEVGLDVVFHQGFNVDEEDPRSKLVTYGKTVRKRLAKATVPIQWNPFYMHKEFHDMPMWHTPLRKTSHGEYSFAVYEANQLMEDISHVEARPNSVFFGIYDGHGGPEASNFVMENLYHNMQRIFLTQGGESQENIMQSFLETDEDFMDVVRCSFEMSPHLATVGSCAVIGVVSKAKLFVGNLGDSRAVLGTVDGSADSGNCLAVPLSQVHNVNNEDVRRELISKFPDDRQIVTERRGVYRVKGKVQVTRAFGDCYLKAREFNQEPLFPRFRVPEPFYPPVITAEPEVTMRLLSPQDQFIIFASDGLWEYVTPQEAVDVVYHTNRGDVARMLIKFTLQRAAKKHDMTYGDLLKLSRGQRREFHDDITVIIFFFTKDVNDTLWGESTYHSVRGNGNDSIRGDTVFEPDRQIQDEEEMDLFGVDDG